jgi:ATPase subunit of ABC transporter with duplicated ATPase domains
MLFYDPVVLEGMNHGALPLELRNLTTIVHSRDSLDTLAAYVGNALTQIRQTEDKDARRQQAEQQQRERELAAQRAKESQLARELANRQAEEKQAAQDQVQRQASLAQEREAAARKSEIERINREISETESEIKRLKATAQIERNLALQFTTAELRKLTCEQATRKVWDVETQLGKALAAAVRRPNGADCVQTLTSLLGNAQALRNRLTAGDPVHEYEVAELLVSVLEEAEPPNDLRNPGANLKADLRSGTASVAHQHANPDEIYRLTQEYHKALKEWRELPFLKRTLTRKPTLPPGVLG